MQDTFRWFRPVVRPVVAAVLAMPVLGGSAARAQTDQPQIAYLLPAGGQRGTTTEVGVRGRHLVGATGVYISGRGATGKVLAVEQPAADKKQPKRLDASANPDLAHIEVTLAPDAEAGERDLRLITPGGVSNRFRFFVGQVPEVNEVEPNSSLEEAQVLDSLPVLVNGQAFQADRDIFRFQAKAGQTLVFQVAAQKILPYIADAVPGWFQSSLTLYDAQGKQLAYDDDFRQHPDPVLVYQVAADGEYLVEIKDVLYRGRDDFVYRLCIGTLPFISHVFPLGWKRGSEARVKLYGVNLPTDHTSLDLSGNCPSRRSVQLTAKKITSNALPFAVGDLPEVVETEPNDSAEQANRIEPPVTINGLSNAGGDVDYFVFAAKAKQRLVMETFARRLDSPMDSVLSIFDSRGRLLRENDDTKDESEGLITHQSDSRLDYTFPRAEDYVIAVRDIQGKGGEAYAYRLVVAPPRPDFILRVRPDNPRAAQGSSALLIVNAFRRDGFSGPIKLSAKGLPEGFVAPDAVIPEKENETRMTITAPPDAAVGILSPTITGTAQIGDREVVREASPAEEQMQAFYYMHNIPSREFLLSVVEAGPLRFSLDLPAGKVLEMAARDRVTVGVKAEVQGDLKGAITLKADKPPRGFRVQVAPIPAGKNETTITITTQGQEVRVGQTGAIIVTASMKAGKQTISGFVPAIPYEIVRNRNN